MTQTRRDFVLRTGSALAALPLAQLVSACTGLTVYRVAPDRGQLRLDLSSISELLVPAGTALVSVEGTTTPLFVVRYNETQYYTLASVCTYQPCNLREKGSRFFCSCHGCTYDRSGSVVKGPASLPLRRYPTRLENNGRTLVIEYVS